MIVFEHGLGANSSQVQSLLGNINMICMDCPGHGDAVLLPDSIPSFFYYAQEVIQLLDKLKIEQIFAGGISMGAGIALHMALKYPDRVRGLVLVRPAWLDQGNPENLSILLHAADAIRSNSRKEFMKGLPFKQLNTISPNAAKSVLGLFEGQQEGEQGISFVLESLVHDKPIDKLENLNQIKSPCMVIGNEDDPLHPLEMATTIHQNIKGSQLEIVPSRYINEQKHGESVRLLVSQFIEKHEKHLE